MRALQITLVIIGLIFQSTQTFRLIYTKWLQPKTSVLERYQETIEHEIASSKNIDELLALYDEAHTKITEYENNSENPIIAPDAQYYQEPYKTEIALRNAIHEWEDQNFLIHKLRFFWFCGLISVIIGCLVYRNIDCWLGITGVISGFTEMIYWTCPVIFGFFGAKFEFERLLNNKLFFSIITWALLILTWFLLNAFQGKHRQRGY